MTRVNIGIPVKLLSDKHLLAEHREIKRIPNHLAKYGRPKNIPKHFKLGKGHVLFLISKGKYTFNRYCVIYNECIRRGFDVRYYGFAWNVYSLYKDLYKDFYYTSANKAIIINRLKERNANHYKHL